MHAQSIYQPTSENEEKIRLPLADNFRALVPATYLLTLLDDPVALQEFEALKTHDDWRVQQMAFEYLKGFEPLHHDYAQDPQQPLDPKTLAEIQHLLGHSRAELRQLGLEWGLGQPDERLAPHILPNLSGSAMPLLPLASQLFRMCCTRDEITIAGIRPFLEMVIPSLPLPADPTPEQIKKNNQRAHQEYEIRRNALKALMYPHGSHNTQDYLLAYLARSEHKLKRELHIAFQYCPDPKGLQQSLLSLVDKQPDPLKTHALYSLSHFHNPEHKQLFLSFLPSQSAGTAQAALRGIQHHLNANDLPALQECRDRWR